MSFGPFVSRNFAYGKRPGMASHIKAALREAEKANFSATAAMVYVSKPRGLSITLTPQEEAPLAALAEQVRVTAHSAYMAFPWKENPIGACFVCEELRTCRRAGLQGLVVHLPKEPMATVLKYAERLRVDDGVRIYLETPAVVRPNTHYDTPEKLGVLYAELLALGLDVGICVDTAHLWVNGVDISTRAAAEDWLRRLDNSGIPPDAVMYHLNDSDLALGTGPDSHAGLGCGRMWGPYKARLHESGLAAFVEYAVRNKQMVILERDKELLGGDYAALNQLLAGEIPAGGLDGGGEAKVGGGENDEAKIGGGGAEKEGGESGEADAADSASRNSGEAFDASEAPPSGGSLLDYYCGCAD